jgi:hypothetical protein
MGLALVVHEFSGVHTTRAWVSVALIYVEMVCKSGGYEEVPEYQRGYAVGG